ncbi:MAG TPA: hypothetical protein VMW69_04055 [Spirochaetia bacterium]|nr:hypothetical protein [Spirochaetia bacterium]
MPRDTQLTSRVEDEEIVIRLGIDSLKQMTEGFGPFEKTVTVADVEGWAQAVAETIGDSNESEGLKSLAQEMMEAAIDVASTEGGRWLEVEGPDEG